MRIKETKVYPFDELSDDAKEKAINDMVNINVEHDWWEYVFEDAANVGIEMTEFDIGRPSYCHGAIEDVEFTANKITQEHGKSCETYKTAIDYLNSIKADEAGDLDNEFRLSILEDYRIMLQKEYEHLTSEDTIIEMIKINEYEFTADGEIT